jgi:hypothetical protein
MPTDRAPACDPGGTTPVVDDVPPTQDVLRRIDTENLSVVDREGNSRPFKSLYSGPDAKARTMFIFTRHAFCPVSAFPLPPTWVMMCGPHIHIC